MTAHVAIGGAQKGIEMFIKSLILEGVDGDVEILHTEGGARVSSRGTVLCEVGPADDREMRFWKAYEVAKLVCGTTRKGEPNATNSMIHDVLNEIERVANC